MRRLILLPALVACVLAALPVMSSAQAATLDMPRSLPEGGGVTLARGGVWVGVGPAYPLYYPPPPVYYPPPPVYYAPPAYYPPPAYYAPPVANAHACYAGPYMCPTAPLPQGSPCSCPSGNGGRVAGRAGF